LHYKTPEEYVISKFKTYDFVFLGEHHRIKHDADFVASLIPVLHKNGINVLAYEFGEHTNQQLLDSLLNMKKWDEQFAYQIASKGYYITWGYEEYLNIIKEAWKLNQTIKDNDKKFRIVFVGMVFYPNKSGMEKFGGTDPDLQMASSFEKEVVLKKEKALVYCGINHAFTSYKYPIFDFKKNALIRFNNDRFGNIIYSKFPDKTCTIYLHSPWASNQGKGKPDVKPVNGVIDSLMEINANKPVGFDVKGSPFGKLGSSNAYYALGSDNFKMEDLCDGYIFLKPYKEYKKVSIAKNFYTDNNLDEIKEFLRGNGLPEEKVKNLTTEMVIDIISNDGNIEKRFNHLMQ
jgi:hypothetical protein